MSMTPINILWMIDHVCYDGSLHGGGRLFWNVLNQFDPEEVRIVPCMLRANEALRNLFKDAPVPVRILDKGKFDPTTLGAFLQIIREENIHVMHLHCYASSTFGRLAGLIAGIPTIIHDYDTEVYFPYPSYLKLADRLLAPATEGAIAASPMVKQFLMEKRQISEHKIRMMFHAIPEEKFKPAPPEKTQPLRRQLGLADNAQILGTVTKLGPQRGNEFLIESFSEIVKAKPDCALVLIYQLTRFHRLPSKKYVEISQADLDSSVHELRSLSQKLGIADKVHLIEWPKNLDDWASLFDVFIAPFLSDRFSSVHLLEAMAKGQPVIATDLGEAKKIVQNGWNGYLISPKDREALVEKTLKILQSADSLAAFSTQAKREAARYSTQTYVRLLQDWYFELAMVQSAQSRSLAEVAK